VPDAYLVDTGVFVRWYVEQLGFEHAVRVQDEFMVGAVKLETVDQVRVELGDVLRRRGLQAGVMDESDYVAAVRSLDDLGIAVHRTDADTLERVALLCSRRPVTFYDGLLVDRALQRGLPLLTADAKLARAVAGLLSTELLEGITP
jgi:predicted nucleic acid-binding protein